MRRAVTVCNAARRVDMNSGRMGGTFDAEIVGAMRGLVCGTGIEPQALAMGQYVERDLEHGI